MTAGSCINHRTGTSTCSGHRPRNTPSGRFISSPGPGATIQSSDITALRNAIVTEVNRWRQHRWYSGVSTAIGSSTAVGDSAQASDYNLLNDKLQEIDTASRSGSGLTHSDNHPHSSGHRTGTFRTDDINPKLLDINTAMGDEITIVDYVSLVNQYNLMRQDCICNSDCGCNAVCSCHNDCGCNYSDRRLKEEIVYC